MDKTDERDEFRLYSFLGKGYNYEQKKKEGVISKVLKAEVAELVDA